jgi:hypothetical protein
MNIIIVIILTGFFFWLCNLGLLHLGRDWPLIIILLGLYALLTIFSKSKRNRIISDLEKGKISVEQAEERLKKTEK